MPCPRGNFFGQLANHKNIETIKNKKEESNLILEALQALVAKKKNLKNDGGDDEII